MATEAELSADRQRQENAERRQREYQATLLMRNSRVPEARYGRATLDDLEFARANLSEPDFRRYALACDKLRQAIAQPCMLVLRGSYGTGKTYLGCATVLEACRQLVRARYGTTFDFLLELKSCFGQEGKTERDIFDAWMAQKVVALDEFELKSETPWATATITNLIGKRDAHQLTTILITNKTREELEGYLGPRLADRLHHGGGVLNLDWQSFRGRQGAANA